MIDDIESQLEKERQFDTVNLDDVGAAKTVIAIYTDDQGTAVTSAPTAPVTNVNYTPIAVNDNLSAIEEQSISTFILENRYRKRGLITRQIYDEISAGIADYSKLKQIDRLVDDEIFKLVSLSRQAHEYYRELIVHLGKGEASCIAYAKERNVIVVTDDRSARKQCSQMKIQLTGTIGILKASVLDGHLKLDQADKIHFKMTEAGFYSPLRSIADIIIEH